MTARGAGVTTAIVLGLGALSLQGDGLATVAGVAALACGAGPLVRARLGGVPWTAVTGATLLALVGSSLVGVPPSTALGALLAYLQVHRRLTRLSDLDDRVSLLLAALMLVSSAGATTRPAFLLLGLGWAGALPIALLPEGAMRARGALGAAAATAALAGLLFVVAPRPGGGDLGEARDGFELTGFSPEVELGAFDELLEDPEVVFRARVTPEPEGPIYWRGIALDRFDGSRWRSTTPPVPATLQAPSRFPGASYAIEVVLEPNPGGVLFTAGRPLSLTSDGVGFRADVQGGWFAEASARLSYSLMALPPLSTGGSLLPAEADRTALDRALRLPTDLDPRVRELAARLSGSGDPRDEIDALARGLRDGYAYTRRPWGRGSEAPLVSFLLDTKAGHCEYFASALAVLARTRGIPARVVNGFVGGERNPSDGWWVVRRYHAHSWVEVHLPGEGWVPVDATPGPGAPVSPPTALASRRTALDTWWFDGFLAYDRGDQTRAVVAAGRTAEAWLPQAPSASDLPWRGLALLGAVWVALTLLLRFGARRAVGRFLGVVERAPTGPVARAHHRARRHVEAMGHRLPSSLPPVQAAERLQSRCPGRPAQALVELAWLYYDVELGGADAKASAPRARALLDEVRLLPPAQVTPAA